MKITKEELANIIKEEVEKALEERMSQEEYADWAEKNGMKLKTVLDKDDNMIMVPTVRPKLPYNWMDMPTHSPERYWARVWFRHHRKPSIGQLDKPKKSPAKKVAAKPAAKKAGEKPNKKGIDSFRFRDRSKPFDPLGARKPRGPQKSSGDAKPVLKGKPILIRNGRRTSLKAKDSQWKFRDGTIIPIYNYIPGRGRVEDEEGLKYYGLSLEEQVADFPSFADWWQGDNRKKYPTPSRARRGYSIARSKAVSQTQKNLQQAADDLKDEK